MKKTVLRIISLALCLLMLAGCGQSQPSPAPTAEPDPTPAPESSAASIPQDNLGYSVGMTIPDFSFTDYNGETRSLYKTLAEKEAVIINIWASWCGPCGMEFPFMEEVYGLYKDRLEIFALSCEPSDSSEVISDYAAEMGLSFPMGSDTPNLAAAFMAYSVPTNIVIDRYGTICAVQVGAKTSNEAVIALFEEYLGDDYAGYVDPNAAPICDIAPADKGELGATLNVPGGELGFESFESEYVWPMLPTEKEGRSVLVSTNQGIGGTASAVKTNVSVKSGDVLCVSFALSSEEALDLMKLYVNGQVVKCFGGEKGWTSYAYPFPSEGEYEVTVSYEKNGGTDLGEDSLWLDSLALLSGGEAKAALAANPVYPAGSSVSLVPLNPDAREVVFDDPQGALNASGSAENMSFYIIPGTEALFRLELDASVDPEPLLFFSDYDGSLRSVISCTADGGYEISAGTDSLSLSGYPYSMLYLEDAGGASGLHRIITYFADEENLNRFIGEYLSSEGGQPLVSWSYADMEAGDGEYCIRLVDAKGEAVPGVTLQVCDDSLCHVFISDEKGECRFTLPAYAYEIHLLSLPDGFKADDNVYTAPSEGGELEIVILR